MIKRKIAFVSDHASPLAAPGSVDSGGQNVYVAYVAQELARRGHLVDVFTRCDHPSQRRIVQWQKNIRVIHVPAGPAKFIAKEQLLPHMEQFARVMSAFACREAVPYELVHAHFFMSGMVASHLRRTLGIPYVMTFHALGEVRIRHQGSADGFPKVRLQIERSLLQEADCVIAECPQDRLDMMRLYDAPDERIEIVPCGFDPEELFPVRPYARRHVEVDDGEFVVLQLGRMVPRKGVDNVVRSMALLRDRYGIRGRLLVVGGDAEQIDACTSPELARLRALADELGLQQQVRFVGQRGRDELRHYYSAADVFVSTPWYEPFGITPVEAMACGTPVIGSEVGGIKSTVVHGQTGFLVPPDDPAALAERMAWLAQHPKQAQRMGRAGLRRACELYTWSSVVSQIVAAYETTLGERVPQLAQAYGTMGRAPHWPQPRRIEQPAIPRSRHG